MFKSKLEKYIIIRVLILFIILSILILIITVQRWLLFAGLTLGTVLSLLRFGFMCYSFSKLLADANKQNAVIGSIIRYSGSMLLAAIFLIAAAYVDIWFFAGAAVGLLLVHTVLFGVGIAKFLGISRYNFE